MEGIRDRRGHLQPSGDMHSAKRNLSNLNIFSIYALTTLVLCLTHVPATAADVSAESFASVEAPEVSQMHEEEESGRRITDMLKLAESWEDIYGLSEAGEYTFGDFNVSSIDSFKGVQESTKSGTHLKQPLGKSSSRRRLIADEEEVPIHRFGGRRYRPKRWTENLDRLLSKGVRDRREQEKRERGSLRKEWLQDELRRDRMIQTYLDYFKHIPGVQYNKTGFGYTKCSGGACPNFEPCEGTGTTCPWDSPCYARNFTEIQACHLPDMVDVDQPIPKPPENCPFLGFEEVRGAKVGIIDPKCTHPIDFVRHEQLMNQVFVLHDVYMNSRGQIFNATHNFDRNGCGNEFPYVYPAETTRVTVFDEVVNLANWNAWAFYHGVIEMLPNFYLLSTILKSMKGIPITHRIGQPVFLETVGQHILGLSVESLNLHTIPNDELFFAKKVIQPLYQWCARPSRKLWLEFRKKYLVPRDGIPMFNPDWSLREPETPASPGDKVSKDWLVVLGKRYHTRGLAQSDEVEEYMRKLFPTERVVIFDGSLSIVQAKEMFNRARLYVAVHGAAMTNMIFMPFNGFVLEMRPRLYHNSCYHYLAEVCSQEYFLTFGDGNKDSHTTVNLTEVFDVLKTIAKRMDEQQEGSSNLARLENWREQ